jgi:hypothetical protein
VARRDTRPEREHPRYAVDAVVEVAVGSGEALVGRTRNLSRGGLCVELPTSIEPGTHVSACIALVFRDHETSEPLVLPARVVWCTPLGGGYQLGCQFGRLARMQTAYLDLFLSYLDASPRAASAH